MFVGAPPKKDIAPPETELVEHFFPHKAEVLRFLANCLRRRPFLLKGQKDSKEPWWSILFLGAWNRFSEQKMGRKKKGFHLGCFSLQQLEKLCVFAFFAHTKKAPGNCEMSTPSLQNTFKKIRDKKFSTPWLDTFFWGGTQKECSS